jgi:hypothetical protein
MSNGETDEVRPLGMLAHGAWSFLICNRGVLVDTAFETMYADASVCIVPHAFWEVSKLRLSEFSSAIIKLGSIPRS